MEAAILIFFNLVILVCQIFRFLPDRIKHANGQFSGQRILLARVVGAEQIRKVRNERGFWQLIGRAVSEFQVSKHEYFEDSVKSNLTQTHNDLWLDQL